VETRALGDYFFDRLEKLCKEAAGGHFVAITEADSPLAVVAGQRQYRKIFLNFADMGGGFGALSFLGLLPAALLDVDIEELLARALHMVHACSPGVPPAQNPGVLLGCGLAEAARRGRDKLTLLLDERLGMLGPWLEQLLAQSTGKGGGGLVPIVAETAALAASYGADRLFVAVSLKQGGDESLRQRLAEVQKRGLPLISIELGELLDIGQEFFRWQMATATAAALMGVNPFNQPDVQLGRDATEAILDLVRRNGRLPVVTPTASEGALKLFAEQPFAGLPQAFKWFIGQARPGTYIAIEAFVPPTAEIKAGLQELRLRLRDRLKVATTLGFGPASLHATGQLHKAGPDTVLLLQLVADQPDEAILPGQAYSFGTLRVAQALGEWEALRKRGRRGLRIHVSGDVLKGVAKLREALEAAFG
jgi:hypothetical protein